MEKTVSLETAINSRTTYAMPGTARHFGVFDPAGVPISLSTVESIARESRGAAGLFGRGPKVYFSMSGKNPVIEASLHIGHVLKVSRMLGYKNYFSLGAFVQGVGLLCAAHSEPLAMCVVGGFKPYAPRRRLSFERVVLRLLFGTGKKSYPYGELKGVANTGVHTTDRPNGWISGNLPDPGLEGGLSLSDVLCQSKDRKRGPMKRDDMGQVLWAGYGSTPHWTHRAIEGNGVAITKYYHQGKTVPSWNAEYGLEIYVGFDGGIYRYVPWNERAVAPTHSLVDVTDEIVKKNIKDVWGNEKPTRIFILARDAKMPTHARWIEAGCSALNMVLQANALGLDVDVSVVGKGRVLALVDVG